MSMMNLLTNKLDIIVVAKLQAIAASHATETEWMSTLSGSVRYWRFGALAQTGENSGANTIHWCVCIRSADLWQRHFDLVPVWDASLVCIIHHTRRLRVISVRDFGVPVFFLFRMFDCMQKDLSAAITIIKLRVTHISLWLQHIHKKNKT